MSPMAERTKWMVNLFHVSVVLTLTFIISVFGLKPFQKDATEIGLIF